MEREKKKQGEPLGLSAVLTPVIGEQEGIRGNKDGQGMFQTAKHL